MKPEVSIIIPVYNTEKYIEECINSVLNQTYTNIEVILIDDGSTDKSTDICREYKEKDKRVKLIIQNNQGAASARNLGIMLANGEWITFVDSDDWLEPDAVEIMINAARINKCDIIVGSHYRNKSNSETVIEPSGIPEKKYDTKKYSALLCCACINTPYIYKNLFPAEMHCGPTMRLTVLKLYKRSVVCDITFPDGLVLCEDRIFNIRAIRQADDVYFINKPIYHYRYNSNSVSHREFLKLCKDYYDAFSAMQKETEICNYSQLLKQHLNISIVSNIIVLVRTYLQQYNSFSEVRANEQVFRNFTDKPLCSSAIKKVKIKEMPNLRRKISLFLLKNKKYTILFLCDYIYHRMKK